MNDFIGERFPALVKLADACEFCSLSLFIILHCEQEPEQMQRDVRQYAAHLYRVHNAYIGNLAEIRER